MIVGRAEQVFRGDSGVILKVPNGVLIGYDETGVSLRLSDDTVAQLRQRLGLVPDPEALAEAAHRIGDVDAWHLRLDADWIRFEARLPGYDHPRGFCLSRQGGSIIADSTAPVLGIFSIGGARRADHEEGAPEFPAHVLSAFDDIGAVGMAGVEPAPQTPLLEQQRQQTQDTRVASALLSRFQTAQRSLPLICTRAETDTSICASDLASGMALQNIKLAIHNLKAAADLCNRPARVAAVTLDYGAEDSLSDDATFIAAMRAIMAEIKEAIGEMGLHEPLFLLRTDGPDTRVKAFWEMSVFPCDFKVTMPNPDYCLERDAFGRLTVESRAIAALTDAIVLETHLAGEPWVCPMFLLAEPVAEGRMLRVTAQSLTGLQIDDAAPFETGANAGFTLQGAGGIVISRVETDPDDPNGLLLHLSGTLQGDSVELHYAVGHGGAVRDTWEDQATGLKRWALPAILKVGAPC